MIRSTRHTLKFATQKKKELLNQLFDIYAIHLQQTIDLLWDEKIPIKKLMSSKDINWMD